MTGRIMLGVDPVTLYDRRPADLDRYGWAEPPTEPVGEPVIGSLQLTPGLSDPMASGRGGSGPYDPAAAGAGTLYLPPEAGDLHDGMVAEIRGKRWVLSAVHLDVDQTGGDLTCWVAQVSEAPSEEVA